jgi:hypothetical protein
MDVMTSNHPTDGFRPLERLEDATGGAAVPLVRMEKPVDPSLRD